ncbi:G2 and S phase-expressed protein 1 isoform X2 [Brienomyrus brachyistius]|uniref:G2 and S phase-expressed protein 1 isoform X2 n=1 Tax=Brienomyrus brachyistius TaxID=42636 RepID=UPI0020B2107A|nr:G2 and S phase-expressed protein 1 isoform X2 [Brienomyrus brachyistius]
MASQNSADFIPLSEEQFDFDVLLSASSGEEDEVFLDPVKHKEKCISVGIETRTQKDTSSGHSLGEEPSWSPLAENNFIEISKEAHLLAQQIETSSLVRLAVEDDASKTADGKQLVKEMFVEDSREKLGLFGKADPALSPIKRDTFCVQDSPMKQLPPAIQHRLLKAGRTASLTGTSVSTSSPVKMCKVQPRSTLRMKAALPQTGVLPSKLAAPGKTRISMKTKPPPSDKNRLAPLQKAKLGLQRSPRGRSLSAASSSEDLLSDTASVASDVSDCSINIGKPAKRSFPALRKSGHQRQVPMKAQALYGKIEDGRKTSSSSSSVSSLNSSLSASPMGKGKLNTSLNLSVNGTRTRVPSGVSRLLSSGVLGNSHTSPVVARKPVELQPRQTKATPVKKLESSPQHPMSRRISERSASLPSIPGASTRTSSAVKVNPKPKCVVPPTPTVTCPDPSKTVKPRKLMSACSLESLNQNPGALEVPQTPGGLGSAQSKLRRVSALPTPVSRRLSGIPMLTPKSLTRPGRLSQASEKEKLPTSAGKVNRESPVPQMTQRMSSQEPECLPSKDTSDSAQLQPYSLSFSLEDETPGAVAAPNSPACTSKLTAECPAELSPQDADPASPEGSGEVPQGDAEKTPENEVLLVDAPAPGLKMEERLLIDLSNTPDLIKTAQIKPPSGQLIDLSSPLITWSPVDKKENVMDNAPLINLSF